MRLFYFVACSGDITRANLTMGDDKTYFLCLIR
jgi:hypothetical protein